MNDRIPNSQAKKAFQVWGQNNWTPEQFQQNLPAGIQYDPNTGGFSHSGQGQLGQVFGQQQQQNPFAAFGQEQQQPQQNFVPQNLQALRNDPQADANKGYIPGVNNEYNPFSNGFFQGAGQRGQNEQNMTGHLGITTASPEKRVGHMQESQRQSEIARFSNPYGDGRNTGTVQFANPSQFPQSNPNQLSAFEAGHGMMNGAAPATATINPWGIGWATSNQPQPGQNVISDETGARFNQPGTTPKKKRIASPFASY